MTGARIIYVYTCNDPSLEGAVRVMSAPAPQAVSPFLPPNCQLLRRLAENRIREGEGSAASGCILRHCELSTYYDRSGAHEIKDSAVYSFLETAGIRRTAPAGRPKDQGWFICPVRVATAAIGEAKRPADDTRPGKGSRKTRKVAEAVKGGHGAADALDWDEAVRLVYALLRDGRYRDCMLVCCGCCLGLRISDLIRLKWTDLLGRDRFTLQEQKTGKRRTLKINSLLRQVTDECHAALAVDDDFQPVLAVSGGDGTKAISRQRADQILKECKETYHLKSAGTFSSHSLRKTFGRKVYFAQCEKGNGDHALTLLSDVFGHSNVSITKRYLGLREEEILSVYDTLSER